MSCRLVVPVILLAAIAALPARGGACECCCHDSTHKTIRLEYNVSPFLYQRDVPYQAGLTGGGSKAAVAGLGLRFRGPIAPRSHWDWSVEGGYGMGDLKNTTTSPTSSTTFETQLSEFFARVAADYRRGRGFYCGPGIEYESTTATLKNTGFKDDKLNPFHLYGFEAHLGGNIPLSRRINLFGETSELIGRGTTKNTVGTLTSETKGIYTENSWQGGLNWRF